MSCNSERIAELACQIEDYEERKGEIEHLCGAINADLRRLNDHLYSLNEIVDVSIPEFDLKTKTFLESIKLSVMQTQEACNLLGGVKSSLIDRSDEFQKMITHISLEIDELEAECRQRVRVRKK